MLHILYMLRIKVIRTMVMSGWRLLTLHTLPLHTSVHGRECPSPPQTNGLDSFVLAQNKNPKSSNTGSWRRATQCISPAKQFGNSLAGLYDMANDCSWQSWKLSQYQKTNNLFILFVYLNKNIIQVKDLMNKYVFMAVIVLTLFLKVVANLLLWVLEWLLNCGR